MLYALLAFVALTLGSVAHAQVFDDTFTGSSGALTGHTPDVGTSWTELIIDGSANGRISLNGSGIAAPAAVASTGSSLYTANATYSSANYEVEATLATFSPGGATRALVIACRIQDANNYYFAVIEDSAGTNDVRIVKVVSGTATKISASEDTGPTTNDVFKLICDGDQISLQKNGSNVISPITDTSITAAGKAGLGSGDQTNFTTLASCLNCQFTRFTVTDLGGSPPPSSTGARRRHGA